jgi:two-component system phosphate regulon response regulator PhoB
MNPSPKILAVDDEPDVLEAITLKFERSGFTVTTASSGAAALECVSQERPDLLILDVMMPEMSGLDVCRTLKNNRATTNIPILMLTAKQSELDRVVGLELGADDYLAKPFSLHELLLRAKAILGLGPQRKRP